MWPCGVAQAASFLSVEVGDSSETIRLNTGGGTAQKVFFLDKPNRLVVDLSLNRVPKVALPSSYRGGVLKAVRAGQFSPQTVRVVFDLNEPAILVDKQERNSGLTLILASSRKAEPKPPEPPLIVIDAGHGGNDPGTIGSRGTHEKHITLEYAKALQLALHRSGRYRVQLTRNDDRFIILRDRIKIAQKAKASLFISLHADSAPRDNARGLSVYTVSEKASDAEAEALAARENKVDILSGLDLSHERADVADILISLAQRDTKNQSSLLADILVQELGKRVKLLNNPHRFAGFAVLKAPDIPSVLIETGFLSNREEERLLKSDRHRDKVIEGIVAAIDAYYAKKGEDLP